MNDRQEEYLKKQYQPVKECGEVDFCCDYHIDDTDKCPCQLFLSQERIEKLKVKFALQIEIEKINNQIEELE